MTTNQGLTEDSV